MPHSTAQTDDRTLAADGTCLDVFTRATGLLHNPSTSLPSGCLSLSPLFDHLVQVQRLENQGTYLDPPLPALAPLCAAAKDISYTIPGGGHQCTDRPFHSVAVRSLPVLRTFDETKIVRSRSHITRIIKSPRTTFFPGPFWSHYITASPLKYRVPEPRELCSVSCMHDNHHNRTHISTRVSRLG